MMDRTDGRPLNISTNNYCLKVTALLNTGKVLRSLGGGDGITSLPQLRSACWRR